MRIRHAVALALLLTLFACTPPGGVPPVGEPPPCTNGINIPEGAGRSFYEDNGEEYYVHNNNWNDTAGGNSVITACEHDNWYVVSDTPDHSDLSVQTYPNVHRDYDDRALSTITSARFSGQRTALHRLHMEHRLRHLDR